jgi:hypothetical protein
MELSKARQTLMSQSTTDKFSAQWIKVVMSDVRVGVGRGRDQL